MQLALASAGEAVKIPVKGRMQNDRSHGVRAGVRCKRTAGRQSKSTGEQTERAGRM